MLTLFIPIPFFEQQYKLCKVKAKRLGDKGVPCVNLHDGRTIRYPDPDVKVNDSVKVDIATGKMSDILTFELGAMVMLTKGRNAGRIGTLQHIERHEGSFDIVTIKDTKGNTFATRMENVFVVGQDKPLVSWPKAKGIKLDIFQEQQAKAAQ